MARWKVNIFSVFCYCSHFFKTCGPLWAQQCGSQYYTTGVCSDVSSDFQLRTSFAPAVQSKLWMCQAMPYFKRQEKLYQQVPFSFTLSHFHVDVTFVLPMEICFFCHFLCSLPFLHRCCGCMWWIKQYLPLGCSKELFGKICTRPRYRPHKDTGMDILYIDPNPQLSFWENITRDEVFIFAFVQSPY